MREDRLRFRHPSRAGSFANGKLPNIRVEHVVPELAQVRDVSLRLAVRPHPVVHRGYEQHRRCRGQQAGAEQVARAS